MTTVTGHRVRVEAASPPRLAFRWSLPTNATLEIRFDGHECSAVLIEGGGERPLAGPAPISPEFDGETGLWHADAPGLLAASWRAAADGITILYARTPLLQRLNLRGGTYELR